MNVDLTKAKNYIVVMNHNKDPSYAPYCLRCPGIARMDTIAPFYWKHHCGAQHDERQVLQEGQALDVVHI